ncbi:MAG TPA: STAS domain-containing protein [Vicinamibacterales bacterium]|nr:STAS domain-containing protein [Vicinamibacterales bacterium]
MSIIQLDGTLRAPVDRWLSRNVQARLDRGERRIIVDLSQLTAIDAAGIGELVRALNVAAAAGGALRVVQPQARVRRLLQIAGLVGPDDAQVRPFPGGDEAR